MAWAKTARRSRPCKSKARQSSAGRQLSGALALNPVPPSLCNHNGWPRGMVLALRVCGPPLRETDMTRPFAAASLAAVLTACSGSPPEVAGPARSSALAASVGLDGAARLTVSAAAPAQVNAGAPITYWYDV